MSFATFTTEGREVMRDGEGVYFLANEQQAKEIAEKLNLLEEMKVFTKDIGEYTGEGGPTTPWRDIVKNIGSKARHMHSKAKKT
jgi:hypothetical protein